MSNQRGDLPWTPAEDAALLTFVPKFRTQLELPASVVARQLGIEVAGRLVRQQNRRFVHHRARDTDALLLAAGKR